MWRRLMWVRYLLVGGLGGVWAWFLLMLYLCALSSSPAALVGLPLLVFVVAPMVRALADVERTRAGWLLRDQVPVPYRPTQGGLLTRYGGILVDPATWRDLAWLILHGLYTPASALLVSGLLAVGLYDLGTPTWRLLDSNHLAGDTSFGLPVDRVWGAYLAAFLGFAQIVAGWLLARPLAVGEAKLARWLLAPTAKARLARRVDDLTASRNQTLDARAAELRRIERDLHDGAQARLVSLAMSLGMAEEAVRSDPETAERLLAEARGSATAALTELRDLVRGIHPPVLADRGLTGALQALALQSAVPVELALAPVGRLAAPVESALYFTAAEALANVAKHSQARGALLTLARDGTVLHLSVRDDGRGGATLVEGGGLAGIAGRVAAFDGRLALTSPVGGPTVVHVELPCVL
jgi:signal transduction histidine kinase